MGLDLVEMVIRTEETFGISIAGEDAANIRTPRELADFISTKVSLSDQPSCLSQQAFYFLRGRFNEHLSFSRRSFRPDTPLEELVPKQNRKIVWAKLQSSVGENALPDLARPTWLFRTLAASTVFVFCYITLFILNFFESGLHLAWLSGLTAAITFGYFAAITTRSTKQYFRSHYKSVGDVTRLLVNNKPYVFKRNGKTWTREQILTVVRLIILDETGIEEFSDDADFIRDLHLD